MISISNDPVPKNPTEEDYKKMNFVPLGDAIKAQFGKKDESKGKKLTEEKTNG